MPACHPLRIIKRGVEAVLEKLSPLFDKLYAGEGPPSIRPEQLLKARVLTALLQRAQRTALLLTLAPKINTSQRTPLSDVFGKYAGSRSLPASLQRPWSHGNKTAR